MASPWDLLQQSRSGGSLDDILAQLQASQGNAIPSAQDNQPMIDMQAQAAQPQQMQAKAQMPFDLDTYKKYLRASEENRKQQEQGLKTLEEQIKLFRDPSKAQMNLQPLLAFADYMNEGKTNLAGNYRAPTSQDERQVMAIKLEEALQGRKGELSKTAEQAAKDQLMLQALLLKSGQKPPKDLSPHTVEKLSDAQTALDSASGLKNVIELNKDLMGPAGAAKATGLVSGLAQAVGSDYGNPERELQSKFDLVRQRVGKLLEGGVLRKEDEEKYRKILPTIGDDPKTAMEKAATLENMLKVDLQRHAQNLAKAGYNMSNFGDITSSGTTAFSGESMAPQAQVPQAPGAKAPKQYAEGTILTSPSGKKAIIKNGRPVPY